MERIFSLGEISDQYWSTPSPPAMNRSSSEWAFHTFLEQQQQNDVVSNSPISDTCSSSKSVADIDAFDVKSSPNPTVQIRSTVDSDHYQSVLKNKLDLACAAVALTKAPFVINQSSSSAAESATRGSADTKSGLHSLSKDDGITGSQSKDAKGPVGIPSLPSMQETPVAQPNHTTSCSSREQSDDEVEGENETGENRDPADVRRTRRMLSNRESARRSRRRKQAHLTELETQVSQMGVENSSLLKRLSDISQKYNEAAVDNRVLKADVETLRAKVKMAEETVKRVTGMNPLLQVMSGITTMGMTPFNGSPCDSVDPVLQVQDDPKQHQHFFHPVNNSLPNTGPREVDDDILYMDNMLQNASVRREGSLEQLQKQNRGGINQGSPLVPMSRNSAADDIDG